MKETGRRGYLSPRRVTEILHLFLLLSYIFLSGCMVNIGGRERPMVSSKRIKGNLELVAEYEEDSSGDDSSKRKSKLLLFEERLNLETEGDVYHRNLLAYSAALGLGLVQQDLDSDEVSGRTSDSIMSYDLSGALFREKPYRFSFNLSKSEDVIGRQFASPLRNEYESEVYTLNIVSKDWPMRFSFERDEVDQRAVNQKSFSTDSFTETTRAFDYTLRHKFNKLSDMDFNFNRSEASRGSAGGDNDTDIDSYNFHHRIQFFEGGKAMLSSSFNFRDQTKPNLQEETRWRERLTLHHSEDLETRYTFEFNDMTREDLSDEETRIEANLTHRFYDSLVSNVRVLSSHSELQEGSVTDRDGGRIGFVYHKKNRFGTFYGDYGVDIHYFDQSGGGGTGVSNGESHRVPDNGSSSPEVELNRLNVDESSIRVFNGVNQDYTPGIDYSVTTVGGRTTLTLFTIGGGLPPDFNIGDEFFVDYTYFVEPELNQDTLSQRYGFRQRFNNGVSLYYKHARQDENLHTNSSTIVKDEYRRDIYGAAYEKNNLLLSAEFTKEVMSLIPMESTSVEARYFLDLGDNATISVFGRQLSQDFSGLRIREMDSFTTGTTYWCRLSSRLSVSADMEYHDEDDTDFGVTKGFEINSELSYNYRQLSAHAGVEYDFLKRRATTTDSLFVYFRVKRTF